METVNHNGLDVTQIAPDCGEKFSPNLYRWLTSRRDTTCADALIGSSSRILASRVYQDPSGTLWIGALFHDRELIGSRLMSVLCNGASESTAAWQNVDAVEVPDFWARYMKDGWCAIDVDHTMSFIGDLSRWRVSGDSRSCQWFGNVSQVLKRWTKTVQCEEWVNAGAVR